MRLEESAAPIPRPRAEVADEPVPDVRLVRADGVVQALEVRCRCCGELTYVELDYEPTSP